MGKQNQYLYIRYQRLSPSGKTKIFKVLAADNLPLGEIRWYGQWRKYAFFPLGGTLWEQDCLRKVADFCERQSKQIRQDWAKRRKTRDAKT